ncbi:ATP-grasp domain-containing protein [Salisediminibacterium halotolerans]|uniref:D-alanine-D-alanine ligase n=1 Tax=Salisediminibacterium halotolerans TaxID=517425 RepID=A0A1H9TWX2_9BACI|nr:ATP-grasp domain-containing protein [Salisediminibacterium haloalkalitolerans]SES01626.1 D-alanine-D-alanine ligase [Salisediminibacterium haloalkalitolerans]
MPEFEWFDHLQDAVPYEASEQKISLYTIALEGWRRGLDVSFLSGYDEDDVFHLHYAIASSERKIHFKSSESSLITQTVHDICRDKFETNKRLREAGVKVPAGKRFTREEGLGEVVAYANETAGFPLVVKPTTGYAGKGVYVNIQSEEELAKAVKYVFDELGFPELIVEEYLTGVEIRVMVVGDEVIGAVHRTEANVVGDGKLTVKKLIEQKNEVRKQVPHLQNRPIKLDRQFYTTMRALNQRPDMVPKAGEKVVVKRVSNISAGGDPVDVTDQLTEKVKQLAVQSVQAIPGLPYAGVDIMVDDPATCFNPKVIEVNTSPGIGSHLFPIAGKARDVPKALIDLHFPETKGMKRKGERTFFRLVDIEYVLRNRFMDSVLLDKVKEDVIVNKITLKTSESHTGFKSSIRRKIQQLGFIGEAEQVTARTSAFLLGHDDPNVFDDFSVWLKDVMKDKGPLSIDMEKTDCKISHERLLYKQETNIVSRNEYEMKKAYADFRKHVVKNKKMKRKLLKSLKLKK